MTKIWQLRALGLYLTLGIPLAASCAREANTLEGDDAVTEDGGSKTSAGSGSVGKAGSQSSAFGGTSSSGGAAAGGKSSAGGKGGVSQGAGESGATSVAGKAGSGGGGGGGGGTGGSSTTVPPAVLAHASAIVYYQTSHATAMDGTIQMKLFIVNQSTDPLPMANVKIRYWFTAEVATALHQYYTGPQAQGPKAVFVNDGKNSNALLTFSAGSIVKGGDMNASEVQLDITNDSGKFNQSDDFSWNPADSASMPNDKITLYLDDKLIWGCEPSGKCGGDGSATGGAGGDGSGGAP